MKLNPDCIRDVLLAVEEHTDLTNYMHYPLEAPEECRYLSKYPQNVVEYHVRQCELAGLLSGVSWYLGGECSIGHLSPKGHEFLENIRSNSTWEKTKTVAKDVGSFSLQTLTQIATSVISEIITKRF